MKTHDSLQHTTNSQEAPQARGAAPTRAGDLAAKRADSCPGYGGQTTISPPAKENLPIPLASGIDTLYLAIDIEWSSETLFSYLTDLKNKAVSQDAEQLGQLDDWPFRIVPYGMKGYEWLLLGKEFTLRIGNWLTPKTRPSVMVEIRSETLWHLGPQQAVERILELLEMSGANLLEVKASRVDLCLDLLFSQADWSIDLRENIVSRATNIRPFFRNQTLTGMQIGQGNMAARLYDKALEIRIKSHKFWMFDIWGLDEVPEGAMVLRVEFQMGRELIKDIGLNSAMDVITRAPNAWAYASQSWLKFQDRPGKHHNQRTTFPWWEIVQNGFTGAQDAWPLVRAKALRTDKQQLAHQTMGLLSSLIAVHAEESGRQSDKFNLMDSLEVLFESAELLPENRRNFDERVHEKLSKYSRQRQKIEEAEMIRRENEIFGV